MSAPLYELTGAYQALLHEAVNEETGEVNPEFQKALDALEGSIQDKLEGCAKALRILGADAEALSKEETRLFVRRQSLQANADRLREYMRSNMLAANVQKVKSTLFTIWVGKPAEKVEIENLHKVPNAYLRQVAPTPDLTAIKRALQDGLEVPGAKLITGQPTLNIR